MAALFSPQGLKTNMLLNKYSFFVTDKLCDEACTRNGDGVMEFGVIKRICTPTYLDVVNRLTVFVLFGCVMKCALRSWRQTFFSCGCRTIMPNLVPELQLSEVLIRRVHSAKLRERSIKWT